MNTIISLNKRELDKINAVIDILKEYSNIYSAVIKDHTGTYHDTAGSAINLLNEIIENNNKSFNF